MFKVETQSFKRDEKVLSGLCFDLAETKCVPSETNDTAVTSTARSMLNIDE